MTAKDLKNALLQEAVQGKLVPQIASEGNAIDLLEEIRKEKAKVAGKASSTSFASKTRTKELPPITEEDIPFDIPENWCWCRLGDFCDVVTGSLDANAQDENGKYAFFTCGVEVYKTKQYAFDCDAILLGGNNASGDYKMHRYKGKFNAYQRVYVISGANTTILDYFEIVIKYWLPHLKKNSQGTTTRFIKLSQVNGMYVPLPPLAEQKRIVAAIEKFMPLIEEYGKKETELKAFNEQIGTLTKKAILQEAVQGKLVPQIAAEGNAKDLLEEIKKEKANLIKEGKLKKEKPLPEITEDEIPFDIPENWCWCRLSEYLDIRDGTHKSPKFYDKGIPFVTSKNLNDGILDFSTCKYITEEDHKKFSARSFVEDGDILFAMIGSIGNPVIVKKEFDFSFKNMALFKRYSKDKTNMKYIFYYLSYIQYELKKIATGGVQSFIGLGTFREMAFPLPPLDEQKRIVEAIEKLLPLCEKLGE